MQATAHNIEFRVALQPIVNARTGRPAAHEALVRGANGEGAGDVLCRIPARAKHRFDRACQAAAIREFARTEREGYVTVNLFPTSAYSDGAEPDEDFIQSAQAVGLPMDRVIVEISESEAVGDWQALVERMNHWRSLGAKIAYDDFCAGYSGLVFLKQFQPDLIKLDMALIRDIDSSEHKRSLVRSIAALCAQMDIEVIAEGIETEDEAQSLMDLGIDLQQGYYWHRPVVDLEDGLVFDSIF